MLRRVGLGVAYFIAIVFFLSILLPAIFCLGHGCKGPDLDAFMPAFMLTPLGGIATAFSLRNAIQQIKARNSWAWVFWPLTIIFGIVLLGAVTLIALLIYFTAFHRR